VAEHTTGFSYDPNGNPLTRTHDAATAALVYDVRDAVAQVTNTEPGVTPKVSTFTYTPKGKVASETAANGNTVAYEYSLDGLVPPQALPSGEVTAPAPDPTAIELGHDPRLCRAVLEPSPTRCGAGSMRLPC
jgi:YD repeat-containing protein